MPWYRGNTHSHTTKSDGALSPTAAALRYRELGYDFLFVTDHDYLTDVDRLNAEAGVAGEFLILPGQEITQMIGDVDTGGPTYGHVNSLFAREVIIPIGRVNDDTPYRGAHATSDTPVRETLETNVAAIIEQGAIPQVNHPNCLWSVHPEDLDGLPDGTLLEVWNSCGVCNNLGGVDFDGTYRPPVEAHWDRQLSRGKTIWGVGADDSHDEAQIGRAWVVVSATELTAAAIETALRRGDFYAAMGMQPDRTSPHHGVWIDDIVADDDCYEVVIRTTEYTPGMVPPPPSYVTRFIGLHGEVLAEEHGSRPSYRFQGGESYVRASIIDSEGNRAWTQPVFRAGAR